MEAQMAHLPTPEIIQGIIVLALILALKVNRQKIPAQSFLNFLDRAGWQLFWLFTITKVLPIIDRSLNG